MNGLDDLAEPTEAELETVELELTEIPAANGNGHAPSRRKCRGCKKPITGPPTKQWCSTSCRKRHSAKPQVAARSSGSGPVVATAQTGTQTALGIVPAAATVTRVEFVLAGEGWCIARVSG